MPRGLQHHHTSTRNYSVEELEALGKCRELSNQVDKIESRMKLYSILTLVIGAPLIAFIGIAYGINLMETWIIFLIGGLVLAGLFVALFFIIKAQLRKRKMKKEIKELNNKYNLDFYIY